MKSIKEKAEEWADMYPSCGMADKSFQSGASYVLDAITDVINQPMNDYLVLGELKKMILQLKK